MRLLVITQKVDADDSNLGFFHVWLEKLAARVDHLYIICLQEGKHNLPENRVTVLSLGKEVNPSWWNYLKLFYHFIWRYRREYDGVFVHMNPEYVVLGGPLWRIWGKKVLLWYTHKSVDLKLKIAEKLVTKIFTASKESFRLDSKKVEIVGHGIEVPPPLASVLPMLPLRLLTIGRVTPSKDVELLIRTVAEYKKICPGAEAQLTIFGMPITDDDARYQKTLEAQAIELGLETLIQFAGSIGHEEVFHQCYCHHIFLHASKTGSIDKAVLEALAAGMPVISASEAFVGIPGVKYAGSRDPKEMAAEIEKIAGSGIIERNEAGVEYVRKHHNLEGLVGKIVGYF